MLVRWLTAKNEIGNVARIDDDLIVVDLDDLNFTLAQFHKMPMIMRPLKLGDKVEPSELLKEIINPTEWNVSISKNGINSDVMTSLALRKLDALLSGEMKWEDL